MAGTGTYSAYRQLKPLEGDISQDIQQQEENGFKRRALDQAEEREKNDKAEKEQKRKDDLLADIKAQNPTITGSKSLDEVNMKGILAATNQWKSVIPVLEHPEKYSEQEVIDARIKKQNLNSFADKLANGNKILMDQNLAYQKAKSSGEIWENPIYENNFQTGFSNKVVGVTKEGNPALLFIDVNNDGLDDNTGKSGKIGDYIDYNDLLSGTNIKYDFQPRFDRDKELETAYTKLVPVVNGTDNGVVTRTETAVDPNLLKKYVANQLFEADGVTPTPKLKSFAREAGVAFDDAKGLKKLSDQFENDIKLHTKRGVVEKRNYSALDVQKEQRQAAKDARAEKKKDEPQEEMGLKNINQVGYVKGNTPAKGSVLKNMDGAKAYSIEGSNLERSIGKKGAYQRVNSIYVLKDGKTLAFEVDNVDGSESSMSEDGGEYNTSKTTKILYRSDRHTNEIGDFISKKKNPKTGDYYKNIPEFMEDALNIPQKKSAKKQNSKSIKAGYTEGGYRFKGGDTKNPKNWVKI